MFWSFTWLITPAILLGAAITCGVIAYKIVKKIKSKRRDKSEEEKKSKKGLLSRLFKGKSKAQTQEQVQEETIESVSPIEPASAESQADATPTAPETDAEFLKALNNNFRFDARNFDMISTPEGKKLYLAWLNQKEIFDFMTQTGKNIDGTPLTTEALEKTAANIAKFDALAQKQFGHNIFPAPNADFALTLTDETGAKLTDNRNIIFCGNEDTGFKNYFATNQEPLNVGEIEPIILQLDLENTNPIIVSSTFMGAFNEGCKDVIKCYADYVKSGNAKCTAHFISGENEARAIDTKVCETKEDLKAFLAESFDKIAPQQTEKEENLGAETPHPEDAPETNPQTTLGGWLNGSGAGRQTGPTYNDGLEK